jgi:hypothetical protein
VNLLLMLIQLGELTTPALSGWTRLGRMSTRTKRLSPVLIWLSPWNDIQNAASRDGKLECF